MKLHARTRYIKEFEHKVQHLRHEHQITDGEWLAFIATEAQRMAKYMIRFERHGDYDTPGGIEE